MFGAGISSDFCRPKEDEPLARRGYLTSVLDKEFSAVNAAVSCSVQFLAAKHSGKDQPTDLAGKSSSGEL